MKKSTANSGDTNSDAAALRSTLTGQLHEHVYLAGMVVATAYATEGERVRRPNRPPTRP